MTAYQIHRPSAHTLFSETVLAPGWYVKFYLTGTSTPVDVYTTSALNVAHDWPVEADAAGVLPVIYLDPTVVYKTEVYDQNDVLQPEYGADPANEQLLSQSIIGELLNPETDPEAGLTIVNHVYVAGVVDRYGTNTTPGTTDMTTAIQAANAQRIAGGQKVRFLSATYKYVPTAAINIDAWEGEGPDQTIIDVFAAAGSYAGTVFRHNGKGKLQGFTLREKTGSRVYPAIMLQVAFDPPSGGSSDYVAYMLHESVRINGGAICRDIGNVYSATFVNCAVDGGGTGTKIIPAAISGGGFFATLTFVNEFNNSNNQGWNVAPPTRSYGLQIIGGATQNQQVSASVFTDLNNPEFFAHFLEQIGGAATTAVALNGCTGVSARFIPATSNCDLSLGTNTTGKISGWKSSTSHILGADGTQDILLEDCDLPSSGNAAIYDWKSIGLKNTTYSGTYYRDEHLVAGISKYMTNRIEGGVPTIASATTIAPAAPVSKVSGTTTIATITVPADIAISGGYLDIIPTGLWAMNTAGNIAVAVTAVVNRVLRLYWDSTATKWYPSYV